MIMYRYGRVPLSTGRASKMSNPSAHPGQTIFMNDDSQVGNMAIFRIAVPRAVASVAARLRASRRLKRAGRLRFGEKGK
jgi:hypothetical protein